MDFLQWEQGWLHIPMCFFSTLKITLCPPLFISMHFVQLQHPETAGMSSKNQTNCSSLTFYRISYRVLICLVCMSEQTLSLHETICRCIEKVARPPLSPSQTYDILSQTSSLAPSLLIPMFIRLKPDLLWWQPFFFLPFAQTHTAWNLQNYLSRQRVIPPKIKNTLHLLHIL